MHVQKISITKLETNKGQVEGLPKNPRLIKDEKFKQLVQSIKDDPEMLDLRECIVYPFEKKFVVIGGNMRLEACKELKHTDVPCKVLEKDTPVGKLRAYAIKDNVSYGENDWELLANDWDTNELMEWGMDIPVYDPVNKEKEVDENIDTDHECPKCHYKW
jgi:hypothetical protein